MSWETTWPLYTVFPVSTLLFVGFYAGGHKIWMRLSKRYATKMSEMGRMSFRQNMTALLHTLVLCPLLLVAIVIDPVMRNQRPLSPHRHRLLHRPSRLRELGPDLPEKLQGRSPPQRFYQSVGFRATPRVCSERRLWVRGPRLPSRGAARAGY